MKRIFIEREKCYGCMTCVFVCMHVHRRKPGTLDDLTTLVDIESRNHLTFSSGCPTPIICRHCDEPECVAACMSGALHKSPKTGHVSYDKDRCGQCFMCVMYCPFGLPRPDMDDQTEVIRCNFCARSPEGPSCAAACPTGTITVREVG